LQDFDVARLVGVFELLMHVSIGAEAANQKDRLAHSVSVPHMM
jgi:hypothetical protein